MYCEGCSLEFDEAGRRPKVIPCGHTLCLTCLADRRTCHVDNKPISDVSALPDNFYIISLLDGSRSENRKRRFYCLTCKTTAQRACEEGHDICSLERARRNEVAAMLDIVRRSLELQGSVARHLMTLIPAVADTFHRLLDTATTREDELQRILAQAEGVIGTSGDQVAWEAAAQSLKTAALQCDEQLPHLQKLWGILEFKGHCQQIEMEFKENEDIEGFSAWNEGGIFLRSDTEVSRVMRLMTFILGSLGHLQFQDEEGDNAIPGLRSEDGGDSDAVAGPSGRAEAISFLQHLQQQQQQQQQQVQQQLNQQHQQHQQQQQQQQQQQHQQQPGVLENRLNLNRQPARPLLQMVESASTRTATRFYFAKGRTHGECCSDASRLLKCPLRELFQVQSTQDLRDYLYGPYRQHNPKKDLQSFAGQLARCFDVQWSNHGGQTSNAPRNLENVLDFIRLLRATYRFPWDDDQDNV